MKLDNQTHFYFNSLKKKSIELRWINFNIPYDIKIKRYRDREIEISDEFTSLKMAINASSTNNINSETLLKKSCYDK